MANEVQIIVSAKDMATQVLRGITTDLNQVSKAADNFANSVSRMSIKAGLAFTGITLSAKKGLLGVASDAEQMDNVIDQSFSHMSDSINRWAAQVSGPLQRSTYQMREYSGYMMAMLKPLIGDFDKAVDMSKELSVLAVDMASFWNTADDDVFAALRSGLVGQTMPLRRFGLNLNQAAIQAWALEEGITKSIQAMSEAEKVQLRYEYILAQTVDQQGDAARTAHEYANAQVGLSSDIRNVSEDFGNRLLPLGGELIAQMREGVQWLGDLDDEVKDQIVRWGAFGTALLGGVATFGLVAKAAAVLTKGLVLVGTGITIATSPITLKLALLTAGVSLLAGAWERDFAGMKSTVESFGGGVSGALDAVQNKFETWWHGTSPTGWGDFLWATRQDPESAIWKRVDEDTRRGGMKDKLSGVFEGFKWPKLPDFKWPEIPKLDWSGVELPEGLIKGFDSLSASASALSTNLKELSRSIKELPAALDWDFETWWYGTSPTGWGDFLAAQKGIDTRRGGMKDKLDSIMPDFAELARIAGEKFAATPAGQGTKTIKDAVTSYMDGEKSLGEAVQEALMSELNIPLAGFALTMMTSGKLRLALGIGTVAISLLPEATREGFKETLSGIWQSVKNTWSMLTGQVKSGGFASLMDNLGLDEMLAAVKKAEGVLGDKFLKSFVGNNNRFSNSNNQSLFEELLEKTGFKERSEEYWDLAATVSISHYWETFKTKFGLDANTNIADLTKDLRDKWVTHIGTFFAPTEGVEESEAALNANWIPNVKKALNSNLANLQERLSEWSWKIDLSNFEFTPDANKISSDIGSKLGSFFGKVSGQLISVMSDLGKTFAKDILAPFSTGFASEFGTALKEELSGMSFSDILTGGLTIGIGLSLITGAGAAILGAIGAVFGNAAGVLGLGGIASAIGLLSVGIQLKEALETESFEEFGAKLATSLAAGIGIGMFTGSPTAGVLTFTVLMQLDWEWVKEALNTPIRRSSIQDVIPDEVWLQDSLVEYRNLWLKDQSLLMRANPLVGFWAPGMGDEGFMEWALEKWYQEQYEDPTTRKYNKGVILPGYGGGDILPALLEPGEAVVPKEKVAGGAKSVVEWFRKMGAPGFQFGFVPSFPGVNLADNDSFSGANAIIDDMGSMFSELGKTLTTGFVTTFEVIFDVLEGAAVTILGEEAIDSVKNAFDSGKERLNRLIGTLYPEETTKRQGWGDFIAAQKGISGDVDLEPLWVARLRWWYGDYQTVNAAQTEFVGDMAKLLGRFNANAAKSITNLQSIFDTIGTMPAMADQVTSGFIGLREQISALFNGGARGETLGRIGAGLAGWDAFSQGSSSTNWVGGIAGALSGAGIGGPWSAGIAIGSQIIGSMFPGTAGPSQTSTNDKAFKAQDEQLKKQIDEYNQILADWGASTQVDNVAFRKDSGFLGWRNLFGNVKWETVGREAAEAGAEIAQKLISSMQSVFQTASNSLFDVLFNSASKADFGQVIGRQVQESLFQEILLGQSVQEPLKRLSALIAEAVQDGLTSDEIQSILDQSGELYATMEPFKDVASEIAKQFGLAESSARGLSSTMRNAPAGFKIDLSRWYAAEGISAPANKQSSNALSDGLVGIRDLLNKIAPNFVKSRAVEIVIEGNVNGVDDLKRTILETLDEYERKYNLTVYGIEGV